MAYRNWWLIANVLIVIVPFCRVYSEETVTKDEHGRICVPGAIVDMSKHINVHPGVYLGEGCYNIAELEIMYPKSKIVNLKSNRRLVKKRGYKGAYVGVGYAFQKLSANYETSLRINYRANSSDHYGTFDLPISKGEYMGKPFVLKGGIYVNNISIGLEGYFGRKSFKNIKTSFSGTAIGVHDSTQTLPDVTVSYPEAYSQINGGFITINRPISIREYFMITPGIKLGLVNSHIWYDEDNHELTLSGVTQLDYEILDGVDGDTPYILLRNFSFGGFDISISKRFGPLEISSEYFLGIAMLSSMELEGGSIRTNNTFSFSVNYIFPQRY